MIATRSGLIAAAALLAIGQPAVAKPWRVLGVTQTMLVSLDAGSVEKAGGIAHGWLHMLRWQPTDLSEMRVFMEVDCGGARARMLRAEARLNKETDPVMMDGASEWRSTADDPEGAITRDALCDARFDARGSRDWDDYDAMVAAHRDLPRDK